MKTDTITFIGEINNNAETEAFYGRCKHLLQSEQFLPYKLIVNIDSNGGDVGIAIMIYEQLRKINGKTIVETCNIGRVESSAILIFLAADIRAANIMTTFMVHGLTREDGCTGLAHQDIERYAEIFEERTAFSSKKIDIREILNGNYVNPQGGSEYRFDWRHSTGLGVTTHDNFRTDRVHSDGQNIL